MAIIYNATSTGTSSEHFFSTPVTKVATQAVGDVTLTVQGSLGGNTWFNITASSTAAAGVIRTSTGNFLIAKARVVVSANPSTTPGIYLIGA